MGLTSAMNTSLNGLILNETAIDVIGNNVANAGTNGFKASKVQFATQLTQTFSVGSAPSATNGGTNPQQTGLGATTAAISKDFTQGSITTSTRQSDMAIQGEGFFILDDGTTNLYTRDGSFQLSAKSVDPVSGQTINSRLTTSQGFLVQGYAVDQNFNLITTQLSDIEIPIGDLTVAEQTQSVSIGGALLSTGQLATQGSLILSDAMTDTAGGAAGTDPITAGTLLSSVYPDGSTTALFSVGQTVSFTGTKGARQLPAQSLTVAAGTTVQDLLTLMDNTLGIQSDGAIQNDPNSGGQPGVSVTAGGQIQVVGNRGTANDLAIPSGSLSIAGTPVPIGNTKTQSADGESAVTEFVIYDSLGQEVQVRMTAVLDSNTTSSSTFRYFFDSADDSDADIVLTNGTITFDSNGQLTGGNPATFTLDRNSTAASSPMVITVDFSDVVGIAPSIAGSSVVMTAQDGSAPGTLASFNISDIGVVRGVFDNGVVRNLGQIILARFNNPQGLLEAGNNTFQEGVGSGPATLSIAGTFGAGTVRAGAIELSNTDLGRNLVELIFASANYRGNARVISSAQELVDELLLLGR